MHERLFVYTSIHELGHYFLYTRSKDEYFNRLNEEMHRQRLLPQRGERLHYMIQAVEFGFGRELFGLESATRMRNSTIKRNPDSEYGVSAALLRKHNVPMDKTCLEYIEKEVLKLS